MEGKMIKFVKLGPKEWELYNGDESTFTLNLVSSSITNKFFILTNFIECMSSKLGNEFDNWFSQFILDCDREDELKYLIIKDNVPNIKKFVDNYFALENLDYNKFVDETKVKKTSILFTAIDIEKIMKLSCYLKIYSIISNSENLKLSQRLHKSIYNILAEEVMANSDTISKVFNVIKTKTFRYNLTDRYMWEYIKMIQCKSIDVHVIEIFNFIMNSILVLCEQDKNPITYFIGVVEESVKWFLRSVYKSSVIYDDSISTEDIHGLNINNLKTYSYNDTLGRLKGIANQQIYNTLESEKNLIVEDLVINFQKRIENIEYISPLCECLVFPVLSRLTNVSYTHFKTLSPGHSAILSMYSKGLLSRVFKNDFKDLFSLLSYYPVNQPAIATTYKIKSVDTYINLQNEVNNFFGFKTKILLHKILSSFVGRTSRVDFCNILDGKPLGGLPLSRVENDIIRFFSYLFSNKFVDEFSQMKKIMSYDF
jgi:hypothetical protein